MEAKALTSQWVFLNQVIHVCPKVIHHELLIVCFISMHAARASYLHSQAGKLAILLG